MNQRWSHVISPFWQNSVLLRAQQHEAVTPGAESRSSFSPAELCLFTKVPCNKCEQVTAAGWPWAALATPFFLQLPLTSDLKKRGVPLCRLQLPEVHFGSETTVRGALERGTCGFSNGRRRTTKKGRRSSELKSIQPVWRAKLLNPLWLTQRFQMTLRFLVPLVAQCGDREGLQRPIKTTGS